MSVVGLYFFVEDEIMLEIGLNVFYIWVHGTSQRAIIFCLAIIVLFIIFIESEKLS